MDKTFTVQTSSKRMRWMRDSFRLNQSLTFPKNGKRKDNGDENHWTDFHKLFRSNAIILKLPQK
jgi:hypothetical protein